MKCGSCKLGARAPSPAGKGIYLNAGEDARVP